MKLTQQDLHELFEYRDDGALIYKVRRGTMKKDRVAGTLTNKGYVTILINRKRYKRSRLVFLYHHGYMPENIVDHINRIRHDDRIENLREVSAQCNNRNSITKTSCSGVRGVIRYNNKWKAIISLNNRVISIRSTTDFTEAVAHRLAAEQALSWLDCSTCSQAYQYIQSYVKGLL